MASFGQPPIQAAAQEVTGSQVAPRGRALGRDSKSPMQDSAEDRAWKYWSKLGAISFPTRVMSNVARLVSFYPALLPQAGDELSEPQPIEDRHILDVWEMEGGEQRLAEWVSRLVVHYWVSGQAWLAATAIVGGERRLVDPESADEYEWQIMSTKNLMRVGKFDKRDQMTSDDPRFWRLYNPSEYDLDVPDSPVRHVDEDCEMLMLYRQDLKSNTLGRAAAGIKTLPSRLQNETLDNGKSWDQQLFEDLTSARNPDSPSSHMPLLVYVDDDEAAIINAAPVKLADPNATDDLLGKMEAATKAVAVGLDMPAEMLLGVGDLNHWSAWLIQRQNFDYHLDPLVVRILKDLTPWFKARLEASGISSNRVVLWRNPDSAISNPNQVEQIRWLWENFLIDDETARRAHDVGEVTAPELEEVKQRILIQALASPLALSAVPGLTAGSDLTPGGATPTGVGVPQSTNPAESNDMPETAPPVIQAATRTELDRLADTLARIDQTLLIEAEQAVAREAARLQRVVKSRIAAAARASGRDNVNEDSIAEELGIAAVLALLGLPDVSSLVTPSDVNTDRVGRAIAQAQGDTDKALTRAGARTPQTREQDRTAATARLAGTVAAAVAASVFKRPTPQGEQSIGGNDIVPMADVREAMDVAGGGAAARTVDGEEAWELIGNGRHTVQSLADAGIVTERFQWVYGTSPRSTFEPHLRLDGEVFDRWDDDDLNQDGTGGEWVGGTHFYPGDHRGCRCTYRRIMVDRSQPETLAASAAR